MWRTCSGLLKARRALVPPKPLFCVANSGVVPGREALELGPALPAGGERAAHARGLELGGGQRHLGPGGGRLVRVEAGLLEQVLVVVEDRGRAVEREAQHLAVRRGVVAHHGRDVGLGVELVAGVGQHLADRHHGALGGHHGGGAHFEHLQDVRRGAGAERGHGGRHGFVVGALVGGHDLVVLLAGVEAGRQVEHPVVQAAGHRMPPLDFDLGPGRAGKRQCGEAGGEGESFDFHDNSVNV